MAVVTPEERSAAGGVTGVARTMGAAMSPLFVGSMFARPDLISLPFFIAGTLKNRVRPTVVPRVRGGPSARGDPAVVASTFPS